MRPDRFWGRVFIHPRNTTYLLALALGCDEPEATCAAVCPHLTRARGVCLAERELSWADAGYPSAAKYQEACETWAWEQAQIARSEGTIDNLKAACITRKEELATEPACEDLDSWDWNLARSSGVSRR